MAKIGAVSKSRCSRDATRGAFGVNLYSIIVHCTCDCAGSRCVGVRILYKVAAMLKVCPFLDCPIRSYLESWQKRSSDLSNIEDFWPIPLIYYEAAVLLGPSQASGAALHPLS